MIEFEEVGPGPWPASRFRRHVDINIMNLESQRGKSRIGDTTY